MPFKVDIQTNFDTSNLNEQDLKEILFAISEAKANLRNDIYPLFLGNGPLIANIFVMFILFSIYLYTNNIVIVYAMPVSTMIFMTFMIVFVEKACNTARQKLHEQYLYFRNQLEALKKQQAS